MGEFLKYADDVFQEILEQESINEKVAQILESGKTQENKVADSTPLEA